MLLFDWIARIDPSLKTAEDGRDAGIAVMQKNERRTGASHIHNDGCAISERGSGFLHRDTRNRDL
jgi:hypothetical protein